MPSAIKIALEDLLKARRLQSDGPPLRGEDRRGTLISTGIPEVDDVLLGGLPRGQISEIHGPVSSGRTALAVAVIARSTAAGALAAWVDPADRLDPESAALAGVDLTRLLWLRGRARAGEPRVLADAVSAVGTLLGSGLFEVVVLDVAGVAPAALRRLPGATWIRLQRVIETQPAALLLVAESHVAHGPGGATLLARGAGTQWSGAPGPGRLLRAVKTELRAGRHALRTTAVALRACS